MKQMICLLSEQLVPTYVAVKHYRPQRVWRILTEKTRDEGRDRMFCEVLSQHAGYAVELPDCSHLVAKPTHYTSTHEIISRLLQKQGENDESEWLINVTGGNKMMAIGAAMAGATHAHAALLYTDIDRPDAFINAQTGQAEPLGNNLSIAEFLALYGFRGTDLPVQYDEHWIALAREFAKKPPYRAPFLLKPGEAKLAEQQGLKGFSAKLHDKFPAKLLNGLKAIIGEAPDLDAAGYKFMQGLWLEAFMYDVMSKYAPALGLHDIRPGLNIDHAGGESNLDIAFMRGLDFCYVECKAGAQIAKSGNDQIEETAGTLARLRALRAKAMIATTGANLVDHEGQLRPGAKARLNEARINIMTRKQIVDLAYVYYKPERAVPILKDFIHGKL